jgi:beta-glucanase (GH16 family)
MIYKIISFTFLFSTIIFPANIHFSIDMSDSIYPNDSYDSIVINGNWNDWQGWGISLNDDDQNGIYEGTLNDISNGTYEYVIAVTGSADSWSGWGITLSAPLGSLCDLNPDDQYANYGFVVGGQDVIQEYCSETCNPVCEDNSNGDDGGSDGDQTVLDGEYVLVWNDEFEDSFIDNSKWNFEIGTGNWGWGNGESQFYTDNSDNAYIENGKLVIKAINENYSGSNYTSARMTTRNKGDFTYGKISARIKVPGAGGTWPAFWMMPTNSVYGGWPNSGEIDIMEHYGCNPDDVHSTVHNNTYNWNGGIPPTSYSTFTNATSDFHIYELEWDEDTMIFHVDDIYLGTYFRTNSGWQQWPYDQDFYIILNLAIGSHFMQCDTENNLFPQTLEVDYVRVYQKQGGCEYLGDINNDGLLNVSDVVQLVGFILNEDDNDYSSNCLDVNQDELINIVDIVMIVDLILYP